MANLMNEFPDIEIKQDEPLMKYTYTKTGGPADWLAFPETVNQVKELVDYVREHKMGLTVLGNASNLIVGDGGVDDLTIILTRLNKIEVHDNKVTAQAGASYIATTEAARDNELSGLEFAAGIPGSIGGAIFMNAGAYGGETKNVVSEVTVMLPDGTIKQLTNEELDFGYRHSSIQDNNGIVLDATFTLEPGKYDDIKARMDELNERREAKQPLDLPSCGSVFKRPEGYYAGKLIHDAGLQGYTSGGAQVSIKHAGFIVNIDHGTAADYVNVIHHVQKTVKEKFGVNLETEVRIIGRQD
ncbi:UDP-N-acetylmuramate dehydrogenase [Limosilactobacillus agrestis]|uniref:UDP-N-acetylenolpyruvoylglucosamine reductase n=1 Tax=Limosilactobacillus agrestis TaxID=2759748 RepID=A0A7W3UGB1_9LACO|nr:UDP-N-acetylmuramate dehydrogenase [Limosilactobacillus agrestis]MBB1095017.1 UDP-N-acetylmuramate dehydrogenase [Limosilactobacillus agrestis]MBB1099095.1 UDP-N-acetylmuramate dehydrogenase [Limosilactobacillus agrestis]MCD7112497.1 UDP-N-acetylmuramate dehydrogenase [Limosilactobacillus agrestis]MCD7119397.1 UDP-N-acetylmuramate dehydrogenase [Limosilactobacillus agrestis]MCD7126306.1 UDP-N-acetylmuramate dehydrogenase [Limosilactobacillus agrestis]